MWWQRGGMCERVLLICPQTKLWVSHVGDFRDVDVIGSCHRATQSEGCENCRPTTSFVNTTPGDSCHRHGNECHLFDAMLIYTLSSTFKWLAWSYCMTHLPNRTSGGLNQRLLALDSIISSSQSNNYIFKTTKGVDFKMQCTGLQASKRGKCYLNLSFLRYFHTFKILTYQNISVYSLSSL